MTSNPRVVVVGSANVDLIYRVPAIPHGGQTVLAEGVDHAPGGKGQNQAVASARMGVPTAFVGAIGDDANGALVTATLSESGVDISGLHTTIAPTGTAVIAVDSEGENSIIVAAGANAMLSALELEDLRIVGDAAVLVAQLEIPIATVLAAAKAANGLGVTVIVNAAPARPLPDELWPLIDVLVVNDIEATEYGPARLGVVRSAVVTRGAEGADVFRNGGLIGQVPAPVVTPVDTTGAGDVFVGALAARLAEGDDLVTAARVAVVAASISVERPGAVPSIPTLAEVHARL